MWKFGIYADRDSIFVGGEPGRWIGVHIDVPWSECCREFGAPYALYVHWWPGRCKTIKLPIPDKREDLFAMGSGRQRVRIFKRCSVCQIEGDDVQMVYKFERSIRNPNGIERELGVTYASLCPHHAAIANLGKLKFTISE